MSKLDFVVGLDIGTTKICCVIGECSENDGEKILDIIGIGTSPSHGLKKGIVVDIDATVDSIRKAVQEAELMAGVKVSNVTIGIAGNHIKSFNSSGIVAVKNREVSQNELDRVLEAAKAVAIPQDREVIHVIPQEYVIDGQEGIRDPLGMSAVRLECRVHVVTGSASSTQNLLKCAQKAGLNVSELCLQPLASAEAVLTEDEKDIGVVLLDIGGGTTDLAIYKEGALVYTGILPMGGNHMTNDMAIGLRTPQSDAEQLKVQYGCALDSLTTEGESIEVPGVGGRKPRIVSRKLVAEILGPRVDEIFSLAYREVMKSGHLEGLTGGVVLTGGASLLEGMCEVAEVIFEMPVKRASPTGVGGLLDMANSPKYSTAVGLLKFASRELGKKRGLSREMIFTDKMFGSVKTWIKDLF